MAPHSERNFSKASARAQARPAAGSASGSGLAGSLAVMLLAGYGCAGWSGGAAALAEERDAAATLIVSPQIAISPGSDSALDIRLAAGETPPPKAMLIIRGVPAGASLSVGRAFGTGVWVLPAALMTGLTLRASAEAKGGVLTVALAMPDGDSLAEARIALVPAPQKPVERQPAPTAAARTADRTGSQAPQEPPPVLSVRLTPEQRAELIGLFEKGNENLRRGNILFARQFYLRAAEKGLSEAAFALATTYDPNEMGKAPSTGGLTTDPVLAMKWYQRAMQLGFPEAAERLSELGRR
jgi:hypothetical protein